MTEKIGCVQHDCDECKARLAQPKRPWKKITDEERASFEAALPKTQEEWDDLFNGIEATLKEKNNAV